RRHHELTAGAETERARLDELRALADETADLEPGADEDLRAQRERLRHVTELAAGASTAREALAPEDGEGAAALAALAERALAPPEQRTEILAKHLSAARTEAAPRFAEAVAAELRGIGMGEGEFRVELTAADPGPTGADRAAFLVRPNAGLPFAPVAETASGGELSRIALAIAAVGGGETLVFDEIDAGIGGRTANDVGTTLRRLGERAQVITITHLPQIASLAERHFRVEKVPGDPTHTRIERLDDDERREELQRMLGGREFISALRD